MPWNAGTRVQQGLVCARREVTNADGGEIPWLVPLSPQTKPSRMELDPDDEQDTLARNLGEENYDEKKLKKSALTCKIVAMDQENYIEFPEKLDMFKTAKKVKASANHTSGQKYSPLVHIRSTGEVSNAKRKFYELYVQDVLGMRKRRDVFGITSKQRLNQPPK